MEPLSNQKVSVESVRVDIDLAFDSQFNQVMRYLRKMLGQILFQLIREPKRPDLLVATTDSNAGNQIVKKAQSANNQ